MKGRVEEESKNKMRTIKGFKCIPVKTLKNQQILPSDLPLPEKNVLNDHDETTRKKFYNFCPINKCKQKKTFKKFHTFEPNLIKNENGLIRTFFLKIFSMS
ncbi:hypothetical protein BpHYR1_029990 [Brachionus plicatilis]|uniref:Uncharacterized protein n=1 Tax=Brachionus plicatilis TaxID=10195 RepID=A0A3M7QT76_BRAPC|nr:hypothetical protein BpHYR1_029990 [Brachionus plicatilis]